MRSCWSAVLFSWLVAMALTIREGDVFTIPLTGEKVAIGQIASRLQRGKTAYFMIVYEGAHSEATVDVDSAVGAPIALQAITFDPLIRNGRWQRIANRPVPEDRIRWPIFRSMTAAPDKYAVIDHRLREVRSATRHEVKDLPH